MIDGAVGKSSVEQLLQIHEFNAIIVTGWHGAKYIGTCT